MRNTALDECYVECGMIFIYLTLQLQNTYFYLSLLPLCYFPINSQYIT